MNIAQVEHTMAPPGHGDQTKDGADMAWLADSYSRSYSLSHFLLPSFVPKNSALSPLPVPCLNL